MGLLRKKVVRKHLMRKPAANRVGARKHIASCATGKLAPDRLPVGRCALFYGCRRRPAKIVVLLHGLNDSAKCCAKGVVNRWVAGLAQVMFVVPESPHRTEYSSDSDPGYTWINMKGLHPDPFDAKKEFGTDSLEFRASINRFHGAIRRSCQDVDTWLDAILAKYGLTNNELVLSGFSQGSILAAILGAKRNTCGTIVCGGVPFAGLLELATLMPRKTRTRFLAVNGTKDSVVERRPLEAMLSPYDCEWHWSKGVGHDFPSSWYTIEQKWMKKLFAM